MKNCIHCGVSIKENAAAFCPKCKKPLKKTSKKRGPFPNKPNPTTAINKQTGKSSVEFAAGKKNSTDKKETVPKYNISVSFVALCHTGP